MLILTRKKEESLIINGNIEVKIIQIGDGRIKLGIEAPKEVEVFRKEIFIKIEEENKKAQANKEKLKELTGLVKEK
ncbi:carbon storage regulator CsrA [Helicovermis profundi]|uniref:Translational regulator CsrA n=1 Tax=Helicovermis profundi TaxID=3065157 RepID=A0AAU9E649_9FIRM|nr:hypothetical protein HLPR_25370 [Clostridia bacterium S502]